MVNLHRPTVRRRLMDVVLLSSAHAATHRSSSPGFAASAASAGPHSVAVDAGKRFMHCSTSARAWERTERYLCSDMRCAAASSAVYPGSEGGAALGPAARYAAWLDRHTGAYTRPLFGST